MTLSLGVRIIYDYGFDDERPERGELLTSQNRSEKVISGNLSFVLQRWFIAA